MNIDRITNEKISLCIDIKRILFKDEINKILTRMRVILFDSREYAPVLKCYILNIAYYSTSTYADIENCRTDSRGYSTHEVPVKAENMEEAIKLHNQLEILKAQFVEFDKTLTRVISCCEFRIDVFYLLDKSIKPFIPHYKVVDPLSLISNSVVEYKQSNPANLETVNNYIKQRTVLNTVFA